jgi:hypothetical protein
MVESCPLLCVTVTVTLAVCVLLLASVAVAVNVVVLFSVTACEPESPEHALQFEMTTLVAFCDDHVSVVWAPGAIEVGFAPIVTLSALELATVTVVCAVVVPPAPVAVSV